MRAEGVLIVNRLAMMRRATPSPPGSRRSPALPMSQEDIYRAYRGFGGLVWPDLDRLPFELADGLGALADWPKIEAYRRRLPDHHECDALMLGQAVVNADKVQLSGWRFAGIEVGYFESEYSRFSVLLNDVLFGTYDELRGFADRLNEHLLLSTLEDARALLAERSRLAAIGADLEHEPPPMEPIAVYVRSPA